MIRFQGVTKTFEDGEDAVTDFSLEITKGQFVVLIGPSGCGKTTTMKMINRLIEPTKGLIEIDGRNHNKIPAVELRRQIGYVIQQVGLFPHMTIAENIALVPRLLGKEGADLGDRVDELLTLVNLDPQMYRERYPNQLSGGQQQRVGVVRALAADPPIILMDEPFSALDPITREQLQEELVRLQSELKKTVVFVTHDMDEALKLADLVVLMKDGRIEQTAPGDDILREPASDFVREFIGSKHLAQADQISLGDITIDKPITIEPYRGLAEALRKMRRHRVDSLLVTDATNTLLGIVTAKDIHANLTEKRRIEEVMSSQVVKVPSDISVPDLLSTMQEEQVGYLPVVDDQNKLQGLVTRASLVDVIAEQWGE
ncbi:MAG: betaine/proline/choline family ABC transporter ATP-binding protein [Limnochordia bacterium]|nr:betaine/proline/choline family ABC transporter ATP-binding protein [Limnochordia bacterium]